MQEAADKTGGAVTACVCFGFIMSRRRCAALQTVSADASPRG